MPGAKAYRLIVHLQVFPAIIKFERDSRQVIAFWRQTKIGLNVLFGDIRPLLCFRKTTVL